MMSSRGSVIPLFIGQIRAGKPITVTEPKMTRFLLPLNQAVGLVTFALEHAQQRDVLIRKSPAAEIGDLGVDVLRAVKDAVDPVGILNPGTLIPEADE